MVRELGHAPLSGDCFLFTNRRRTTAKVLHFDGTGLCIYSKRLERNRFACRWADGPGEPVRLTMTELALFLEGSRLAGRIPLSPAPLLEEPVAALRKAQSYRALARSASGPLDTGV